MTLEVRPIVSFDHKYITVRVRPKIEEIDTENALTPYNAIDDSGYIVVSLTDENYIYQWYVTVFESGSKTNNI